MYKDKTLAHNTNVLHTLTGAGLRPAALHCDWPECSKVCVGATVKCLGHQIHPSPTVLLGNTEPSLSPALPLP